MFADFYVILLHQKTLFCNNYKGKICGVTLKKKKKALQEVKKVSLLRMLLLNVTCQEEKSK